jgi:hypothetical protein
MAESPAQNYSNHGRMVPAYHYVAFGLLFVTFIGSLVNVYESLGDSSRIYSASLLVALTLGTLIVSFFARAFPLKAQDRAIRAEEQLRHYVMTGKLLDDRLTVRQIVALRFASDGEFVTLAQRAAEHSLSGDAIKKEIKDWRADTYRV